MDKETNKLAWGFVRDEQRTIAVDYHENVEALRQCVFSKRLIFAQKAGATPKQLSKIETDVNKVLEKQARFHLGTTKVSTGTSPNKLDMHTAFVWSMVETSFEREGGEEIPDAQIWNKDGIERPFVGFTERNFRLGFQRQFLSKRGLVVQWIHQRVALSEHTLYRLVDREVCDREPLTCLSSKINEWLPAINALMLTGVKGGFVPFADGGLVLQTYLVVEPEDADATWNLNDRFAITANHNGAHFQPLLMPSPSDLEFPEIGERKAWLDWRITTYLTDSQLCSSRLWVKLEFEKIKARFPEEWNLLGQLNTMLDFNNKACALFSDEHSDFVIAMRKFVRSHRFKEAKRGPSS